MKVFISQPMYNKDEKTVMEVRDKVIRTLKMEYPEFEVIDNYHKENVPCGAGRLWFLGDSIKQMDIADLIVFADNWQYSKGCLAEFKIAKLYNKEWKFI